MKTQNQYGSPDVGCYVDESSQRVAMSDLCPVVRIQTRRIPTILLLIIVANGCMYRIMETARCMFAVRMARTLRYGGLFNQTRPSPCHN